MLTPPAIEATRVNANGACAPIRSRALGARAGSATAAPITERKK